jgi:hypothetical protein
MSPIALILNLLLGGLLVAALALGLRLDRRLRALRDSQAGFIKAVNELDQAAARTHAGLAQWRDATDEARELLHDRIEKAKVQASLLEKLIRDSASLPEPARVAEPARVREAVPSLIRAAVREAAAAESVLTLTPEHARPLRAEPRPLRTPQPLRAGPPPRARPTVDDDLFDAPASFEPTFFEPGVGAPRLQRDLAEALERRS